MIRVCAWTVLRGIGLAAALAAMPAVAGAEAAPADQQGSGITFSDAPNMQEIIAQQRACEARHPPRKPKGTISESAYKRMERIIDAIAKGQYTESEAKLTEMAGNAGSDYEKAIILQTLGFVYAQENKEQQAINTFQQAIATNALPQPVHEQMMFNVAQLYVAMDNWGKGMDALNAYLGEACNPLPDAHVLLASVYANKKEWANALKQINLAIVKAKAAKETWLQLKLALHYELHDMPHCAEVLVHLVAIAPNKEDYWKQLSGILFEIKKDPEALAVLGLAERKGYIDTEPEYRNLSNMYMYMQIPYKAATVLERGLAQKQVEASEKNLSSLANAWLGAREYEKAEAAMKRAAAASDKGELYKQLAQIQIQDEKWKDALESLQKAQQKGGVKDPGEVAFLIGVCAVQLKQWKVADAALRQAMQHEKTAKQAAQWLNSLQQEYAFYNPPEGNGGQGQGGAAAQNPNAPATPNPNAPQGQNPAPAGGEASPAPAAPTPPAPTQKKID